MTSMSGTLHWNAAQEALDKAGVENLLDDEIPFRY